MSEFGNRINAQRKALELINGAQLFKEPLLSLTSKAIERWYRSNNIDPQDAVVSKLTLLSGTLFFLANKSQEQITEEYNNLTAKVDTQLSDLSLELKNKIHS